MYIIIQHELFQDERDNDATLYNPDICEICDTAEQAQERAAWLDENVPAMDRQYTVAQLCNTDGKPFAVKLYEPEPAPAQNWHKAQNVAKMFNISRARLTQLALGATQRKKGKEYFTPSIVGDGVRYDLFEKRANMLLDDKAVEKLKAYFGKKK